MQQQACAAQPAAGPGRFGTWSFSAAFTRVAQKTVMHPLVLARGHLGDGGRPARTQPLIYPVSSAQ